MKNDLWFEEVFKSDVGLKFRIKEKLFSQKSPFQLVEVFETISHGRLLAHDGAVMTTERDEFIYHDMITHVPLFTHPHPQNILVIGGGDGGTVREVLKHPTVKKCTMVEIDGLVVEVAKKFLQQTSSELNDPKVKVLIEDGVHFVQSTQEKFDVVIVDSSDPVGPAAPLFNHEFYENISRILSEDGIVVSQGETPFYEAKMQKVLVEILHNIFPKTHIYNYSNMSYPSGFWSFTFASKKHCPFKNFQRQSLQNKTFKYYNDKIHFGSFLIPQFMIDELGEYLTPLPDLKCL